MPEPTAENNIPKLVKESAGEPISRFLETRLITLEPGFARVSMKVKPDYLTLNGAVFGGIIMSIADQAFSYAVNSVAPSSLAADFHINFMNSPQPDDELIAECRIIKNGRRVAFAEMTVANQDGKLIAKASGMTLRVNRT